MGASDFSSCIPSPRALLPSPEKGARRGVSSGEDLPGLIKEEIEKVKVEASK